VRKEVAHLAPLTGNKLVIAVSPGYQISPPGDARSQVLEAVMGGAQGVIAWGYYMGMTAGHLADISEAVKMFNPVEDVVLDGAIDRKVRRFMGDGAAYNYLAMEQAIADAGLPDDQVSNERTGLIMGSGGPSTRNMLLAFDTARNRGARKVGPFMVPRTMGSTTSACLGTAYKIKGVCYSISSACATSAHCIGNACELIQTGKQDMIFAGGGEEVHWTMSVLFDAMGALSSKYNDTPDKASRAYDVDRDGFVIAGGGGVVVLEELEHARARGAKIYAELVGYGATSDGHDMVQPSGEGAVRCMEQALATVDGPVDYINAHGTSTPLGDTRELEAIREVFGDKIPTINSTKSLTGHALGAAGVNEAIYSLLMMEANFVCESVNIETIDPAAAGMPIARKRIDNVELNTVMSNSFGFGGANACLVFQRFDG
jgi:3-oxoacyl-[acyl-carrier-protein] synthase-1